MCGCCWVCRQYCTYNTSRRRASTAVLIASFVSKKRFASNLKTHVLRYCHQTWFVVEQATGEKRANHLYFSNTSVSSQLTAELIKENYLQLPSKIFSKTMNQWKVYFCMVVSHTGTAVAQCLRCCATNRKVTGSIPGGVNGIFHWHNPSDRTMALGVDPASNRNEYQEYFLGVKAAGA